MKDDVTFLDLDDVLDIHEAQLERFGGASGVRDARLLESAVAQPQASFGGEYVHEDIFAMAAAYAFHIAQNQPFLDGNKRTGLMAALVFLDLNGASIDRPNDRLYQAMMDIATRRLDKAGLSRLLQDLAAKST
jgi:death on curing protein